MKDFLKKIFNINNFFNYGLAIAGFLFINTLWYMYAKPSLIVMIVSTVVNLVGSIYAYANGWFRGRFEGVREERNARSISGKSSKKTR